MVVKSVITSWWILAKNNLQSQLLTLSSAIFFVIGKLANYFFSLLLIVSIFHTTRLVGDYTIDQAIFFTLIYFIFESVTGFLFRGIYHFRPFLVRGGFDLDLLKPLPGYFRPLLSAPDFLDLPPLLIQIAVFIYYLTISPLHFSFIWFLIFVLLFINAVVLSFAVFLSIAAICVLTTEVDNLVSIYRSFTRAGIVPTDIYPAVFRFFLNTIIPVSVFITVPAKALLGLLNPASLITTLVFSTFFCFLSLRFWRYSLTQYSGTGS